MQHIIYVSITIFIVVMKYNYTLKLICVKEQYITFPKYNVNY